jgi:sugar phosphate isomerase/epimerase
MNTQTETKQETKFDKLTTLIEDWTEIYLPDYLNEDEFDEINIWTSDDIETILEDNGAFYVEIIYYSRAIKYLSENDASLRSSIDLAVDMGFNLEDINSETLASLHASQKVREDFYSITNEIDEILSE